MDMKITFINQSNALNGSVVVICQKNIAPNSDGVVVAWRVLENLGINWKHKFAYPINFYVGAGDEWGNLCNPQLADTGQKWNVVRSSSGDVLNLDSASASSLTEVEIKNCLPIGSIDAQIYKDGKLLATKTGVSLQQKGVFEFETSIWVGVVPQMGEGDILDAAALSAVNTEISLLGIAKADLILTDGSADGTGPPFKFTLVQTK